MTRRWTEVRADPYGSKVSAPEGYINLLGADMSANYEGPFPILSGYAAGVSTTTRTFDTGATRDSDTGKYDIEGFLSPEVLFEFAAYMHKHRHLSDGTVRASDNWQAGIPKDVYMKSLLRHILDLWLYHREAGVSRPETGVVPSLHETLGGILFNVQGYWLAEIRGDE
jgi:hypothetical protein